MLSVQRYVYRRDLLLGARLNVANERKHKPALASIGYEDAFRPHATLPNQQQTPNFDIMLRQYNLLIVVLQIHCT